MRKFSEAAVALAIALAAASAAHAERFGNPVIGISIEKPDDWHVLSAEANADNLKKSEIGSPEFQEAIPKYASVPLFAFTRYPEPYPDLNASVKLNTRPAGSLAGRSGQEALTAILPGLKGVFADFTLVTSPEATTLAGRPAGHMVATYTMKVSGKSYPTASEMWVIPRGDYLIIVGAGYRPDDKTGDRQAVHRIVNSLRLDSAP